LVEEPTTLGYYKQKKPRCLTPKISRCSDLPRPLKSRLAAGAAPAFDGAEAEARTAAPSAEPPSIHSDGRPRWLGGGPFARRLAAEQGGELPAAAVSTPGRVRRRRVAVLGRTAHLLQAVCVVGWQMGP